MNRSPNPGRRPHYGMTLPRLGLYPMELSRNLRVDTIARLDPSPPHAVDADAAVADAVATMRAERVGCVLVTDRGRLVGLFTERDLLARVLARGKAFDLLLRSCMTPNPITVGPGDSIRTAVRRMQKGGYRHLPVVDANGRPVGVVSARRVVHYLVEHFPALVHNQPPDAQQYPEAPEGA
jgi:CBS domain-containing protein